MLLIGPPGSGKTTRLLAKVERAICSGRSAEVQLLVPTGSMKHHLLNVLARKSLMVPARVVSTMSEFVQATTPDRREAREAAEERLLRAAIAGTEFGQHAGSSGLRRRVLGLVQEFWAAGADSLQLEPAARTRRQRAFVEVFGKYETALRESGLVHRNERIAVAAAKVRREGLGEIRQVLVDGFDRFTKQQEELLAALDEQAEEFCVAMPEGLRSYPLATLPQDLLPPRPGPGAETEVVRADSPKEEILEVARRILASKRPLRDHALILRTPEHYATIIQEVFEALRIPYRFWGGAALADHGVARHFSNWLRAVKEGFPGEATLAALVSPLTPRRWSRRLDEFDFHVRQRLPNAGLAFMRDAAREFPAQLEMLSALRDCEQWTERRLKAGAWASEFSRLQALVQQIDPPVDASSFQRTCDWRTAVAAGKALRHAFDDAAGLPDLSDGEIGFGEFAEAFEDELRAAKLPVRDLRYDVVHVLPVWESRQWSMPVAFVCGLAEGWFPRHFPQDPLFDDEDRKQLQARGIDVRTSVDRAEEERFLLRIATTRATERLVPSYPLSDSLGKPLVRSALLGDALEPKPAPWARIGAELAPRPATAHQALPPDLRDAVAASNRTFSASGIQRYRQCPYLYFSGTTLRLHGRPALPEQRLDGAALGTIMHDALEAWNRRKSDIAGVLDDVFRDWLARNHLEPSFRTESRRLALRADLLRFAREQGAAMSLPRGPHALFEDVRSYRVEEIESRPKVRCRIDRIDIDDERRCVVTDYKYAGPNRIQALLKQHLTGEQLQLMIYLAALEQSLSCKPSGMALCGMRGETSHAGVSVDGAAGLRPLGQEDLHSLLATARSETAQAVEGILRGQIAVLPRDSNFCGQFCSFGSMCRVRWQGSAAIAPEAEPAAS